MMICTPMYGGNCTEGYFRSCLNLQEDFIRSGMEFEWLTTSNESLITRARNTMVATFLKSSFDRMMFIDADIEFRSEDVAKLWNLDADVAVGVYPMKRPDAPYAAWVKGELVRDLDQFNGPIEVDYAGTGFMMIKRAVFERMMEAYPETEHEEGHVGKCWALFDCQVKNKVYLSEDYLFCERWREIGGRIVMDPSVRLKHIGSYAYGA